MRLWLEQQGYAYALAVPSIEVVAVQTKTGCLLADVASIQQQALRPADWQRLSQSLGTKGERLFDWAILPVVHQGVVDDQHFLVFRRCLDDAKQVTSYLVFAPSPAPLSIIVQAIGARWHIEEDLEANKDLGLDHYEVRHYLGWYRHITLVMLASVFLVGITVQEKEKQQPCGPEQDLVASPAPPSSEPAPVLVAPPAPPLIALTPSEVRHLLARLFFPAPTSAPLLCHWSNWRRTHQYWAGYYHRRRREKAG